MEYVKVMGYDRFQLTVQGHMSRHNSDKDKTDDRLLFELKERIQLICMEHRYESLNLDYF